MATIRKIQTLSSAPAKKKRVAAYARVSMESENLLRSLSNQVSQYSALIQSRTDWEYAGVYADRGITGTSTVHRDEFNRLIKDCEDGKIDLILVKSISRFARNTVDLLETVRHLKSIGVEVYFEEQGISSMTCDGELMLTLLASFAQAEAESISDNVHWGIQKRFEEGIPNGHKRCLGYDWDGENYVVIPDEAETVRMIFKMYLGGNSSFQIAKALEDAGRTNIYGEPISDYNIRFILSNENYTGNLLLQKKFSPSIGKRAVNRGEMPMYRVEDNHEAIINMDTFTRAQEIRKETAAAMPQKNVTCFSGLLKCGYCGHAVCRRNVFKKNATWICNTVDKKGRAACECSRRLSEKELIEIAENVVGSDYEETIRRRVRQIIVFDDRLEFRMMEGRDKTWHRRFGKYPRERGCFSGKVYCGECGGVYSREASNKKNHIVWRCKNRRGGKGKCSSGHIHESVLYRAVRETIGTMDNYEMRFYCDTDRLVVHDDRLEFYMKDGDVKTWQRK